MLKDWFYVSSVSVYDFNADDPGYMLAIILAKIFSRMLEMQTGAWVKEGGR